MQKLTGATLALAALNSALFMAAAMGVDTGAVALQADIAEVMSHPWQLLSYAFVQTHPLHFSFNIVLLILAGALFEGRRGPVALLATFVAGALVAAITFLAAGWLAGVTDVSLMGCSAATAAIIGATLADRQKPLSRFAATVAVVTLAAMSLAVFGTNAGGGIAHVAGIATGVFIGRQLSRPAPEVSDNAIIDKASVSGFSALTADEKYKLFTRSAK